MKLTDPFGEPLSLTDWHIYKGRDSDCPSQYVRLIKDTDIVIAKLFNNYIDDGDYLDHNGEVIKIPHTTWEPDNSECIAGTADEVYQKAIDSGSFPLFYVAGIFSYIFNEKTFWRGNDHTPSFDYQSIYKHLPSATWSTGYIESADLAKFKADLMLVEMGYELKVFEI